MSGKHFRLFSDCIPVKGFTRSIICDLRRINYYLIPNGLYDIIHQNKKLSSEEIACQYDDEENKTLNEYYIFLLENELGFWCDTDELDLFPDLPLSWDLPSQISNCIIDIKDYELHNYENYFDQLEALGCYHIQIRSYEKLSAEQLENILFKAENKAIKSIQFHIQFSDLEELNKYKLLIDRFYRMTTVFVYGAPTEEIFYESKSTTGTIIFIKKNFHSFKQCGVVNHNYFTTNISFFTESLTYNSCLNRKISIDVNGEIRNCPSMVKSYGNIKNKTLLQALNEKGFKDVWGINKDKINICKDCEFRYICTDCRAYIENPADNHSKPLKCGYDPYTANWEEWSMNPLKKSAISHYSFH